MTTQQLRSRMILRGQDPGYFWVTLINRGAKYEFNVCGYQLNYLRIKKRIHPKKEYLGLTLYQALDGLHFHVSRRLWQERHPVHSNRPII